MGFGYFDSNTMEDSIDNLKDSIKFYYDNPDVRSIIRRWLKKKKSTKVIVY